MERLRPRPPEYLTVEFADPDYATGVLIREVSGNGSITKVELIDDGDDPHTVFEDRSRVPLGVIEVAHWRMPFPREFPISMG